MGHRIETARLSLRPVATSDKRTLHALWTDPGVRRFLWDDEVIAIERVAEEIEKSLETFQLLGFGLWLVFDRNGLLGFAGLRPVPESGEIEILYAIRPERWGEGLATEAARSVLGFGFKRCGLGRIIARADAPNRASVRVMEKLGMRRREPRDSKLVTFESRAN
ncbi:MAG: GNAT family N-acetyltransferase [Planctomycetota bacterium]